MYITHQLVDDGALGEETLTDTADFYTRHTDTQPVCFRGCLTVKRFSGLHLKPTT